MKQENRNDAGLSLTIALPTPSALGRPITSFLHVSSLTPLIQPASSLGTLSPTISVEVPPSQQLGNWKHLENKIPAPALNINQDHFLGHCPPTAQWNSFTVCTLVPALWHYMESRNDSVYSGGNPQTTCKLQMYKRHWTSRWISVLSSPSFLSPIPYT